MASNLDTFMASGKGVLSGGGQGLAIGTNPALMAATGGLSAPIGAAAGALMGGVSAGVKQNKANKSQDIPMVDPMESARLAELNQVRKSLMAGTDAVTQQGISDVNNQASATMGAITKSTGGDVSGTIDALMKSQASAQNAINSTVAGASQRLPYFDSAAGTLMGKIADRRLQLQLLKRSQATAENAQARKESNLSANAMTAASPFSNEMGAFLKGLGGTGASVDSGMSLVAPSVGGTNTQPLVMTDPLNPMPTNPFN